MRSLSTSKVFETILRGTFSSYFSDEVALSNFKNLAVLDAESVGKFTFFPHIDNVPIK